MQYRYLPSGATYPVSEAVSRSLRAAGDGYGASDLEELRLRQAATEDAVGLIVGFLVDCWPNAPALAPMLDGIVSHSFTRIDN